MTKHRRAELQKTCTSFQALNYWKESHVNVGFANNCSAPQQTKARCFLPLSLLSLSSLFEGGSILPELAAKSMVLQSYSVYAHPAHGVYVNRCCQSPDSVPIPHPLSA
jgi:hypothetical protein